MQDSITVSADPSVQYLLRIGDTCLILAQRLGEWCGHAPIVEEDIALTNMALDLVGQSRAVLTRAGELEAERGGERHDEDQLAFLRDERDFRNCTLVELPRGDFAVTVLRNCAVAVFFELLWGRLADSSDTELAAIAGKAVKEARYHREHAADWVVRLGDGTPESTARMKAALDHLWPYMAELFEADAIDEAAVASGLGPRWADLREHWNDRMTAVLSEAGLAPPAERAFRSTGKNGRHSEHLGYILAEMQHLQRAYPGGRVVSVGTALVAEAADPPPPRGATSAHDQAASRVERAWSVLDTVLDPEVPVVSVLDLGIVRAVVEVGGTLEVVVTPTYSGCPATEVIEQGIVAALEGAGLGPVRVRLQRAPAWTTDWMSDSGRRKLREYGISPPEPVDPSRGTPIRFSRRSPLALACPRCASTNTERLAAFGATACKALWRCRACGEPFEHFKPI